LIRSSVTASSLRKQFLNSIGDLVLTENGQHQHQDLGNWGLFNEVS
jgi:hypothetical protein